LRSSGLWVRLHNLKRRLKLLGKPTTQIFEEIYQRNDWDDDESISGHGSRLDHTANIRAALPSLLEKYQCQSLLDIPCGDFNWMKTVALDVDYIGADIVGDLIKRNQERYASARRNFVVSDVLRDRLPRVSLIMCRDCLVHFSNADVMTALKNIKASGSEYLLTTTFPAQRRNASIVTGEWRPLNLCQPPFRLPAPLELVDDTFDAPNYHVKYMGIWQVSALPAA
jgi:hypothetical protein